MKDDITNMTAIFKTHEECKEPWTKTHEEYRKSRFRPQSAPWTRTRTSPQTLNQPRASAQAPTAPQTAPRTVLIEGDPGMGKTTYCQKLAYDWVTSR